MSTATQATSRPTRARGAFPKGPENPVPINKVIGTRVLQRGTKTTKDAQRNPARLCYSHCKPKGPVCRSTLYQVVATPTVKRGFVMSELIRLALARAGLVRGRWACPRGWPHGVIRVFNILPTRCP